MMEFNHSKKIKLNLQIKQHDKNWAQEFLYTYKQVKLHLTCFHDADTSDVKGRKSTQLSIPVKQLPNSSWIWPSYQRHEIQLCFSELYYRCWSEASFWNDPHTFVCMQIIARTFFKHLHQPSRLARSEHEWHAIIVGNVKTKVCWSFQGFIIPWCDSHTPLLSIIAPFELYWQFTCIIKWVKTIMNDFTW